MTNTDHDRWNEELAAYALGALDPPEAKALEQHLEECERCRAKARWLAPAVEALPEGVERREPPRQLRDSLMAEVRADARRERAEAADEGGALHRAGTWLRGIGGSGSPRWQPLAGTVAAVLIIAVLAGYVVGSDDSGGGGKAETIISGKAPGVTAKLVREGEGGTLQLANVRRLPDDKVLEAWVERDGKVEAVPALFVPDQEGRAATTIADMAGVDVVMVTAEPKGGSETPTSAPIVTMPIANN